MYRHEVRPFDDPELKALASFAEQASLAIANANLFNDLDAALERQTAMTDVLDAVSTARLDLQPVFDGHRAPRRSHSLRSMWQPSSPCATATTASSRRVAGAIARSGCRPRPASRSRCRLEWDAAIVRGESGST